MKLSATFEAAIEARARAAGLSAEQYLEKLLRESAERESQRAEFESVIAARLASLDRGEGVDGESVMERRLQP